ncbi:phosphatase PAP2 family protein [Microvirga sp. M2]|uniref:phosphatase PAP2 family protein n=1 Tax=Microvirga sp. M2 TaxID=3073270 RepID=UPI0039C09550
MNLENRSILTVLKASAARHRELLPLAAILIAAGLAGSFLALASEVLEGETLGFDKAILLALRDPTDPANPIGPLWLEIMMKDLTALGSITILALITVAVAGYLFVLNKRAATLLVLASVGGGMMLSNLFKHAFARPRPDFIAHSVDVYTASFPSSHAMLSAVTYLTLGALLARVEARRPGKVYVMSTAILLTLLVGCSRLYLGVHYPTDVLAGWAVGSAWAIFCWTLAAWLQRRGQIEGEREAADS